MTRKKLVKELMALGESRNRAVMYAKKANELGAPYIEAYSCYLCAAIFEICEHLGVQPKI